MKTEIRPGLIERCLKVKALIVLCVASALFILPGQAFASACLKDDTGLNNPSCTAGDVQIALITSPSNVTCEIGEIVEEMSESSDKQETGLSHIAIAMNDIGKVTQSVAQSAGESATSSQRLEAQAHSVRDASNSLAKEIFGKSLQG